jgi:ankyrin repeat protein
VNIDIIEGNDHHARNLVRRYAGTIPLDVEPLLYESISVHHGRTTPFAEAIRWKRPGLVTMFKGMGIMGSIMESERFSAALFAAAEAGDLEMTTHLLGRTSQAPELISPALSPSISIATHGNHGEIVEQLMSAGIKPITSSLTMAVLVRKAMLVRLFLDAAVPVAESVGLLYLAVRWGDIEVISQLIKAGIPMNESGLDLGIVELNNQDLVELRTPLAEAIWCEREDVATLLLDKGARINRDSYRSSSSPLAIAIRCDGKERLVRDLLARGANANDPTALLAATRHSVDMTSLILGALCRQYPQGHKYCASSALRRAIIDDKEVIVRMLATHTELNDKKRRREEVENWSGERGGRREQGAFLPTLLGEAIMTCNLRLVQIILDSGGDANSTVEAELPAPRVGRWPALSLAIYTGSLSMVRMLHDAGAKLDYDAQLRIVRTPLQLAVELGHYEIIEYLLDHGADVNSAPCLWGGSTAL